MKNRMKILLGLIVTGIVAVALICYFTADKPVDYVKATPEYIIKAKRLYNDYALNPDLANEKYTGKIIQLNGRISEVELADSVVTLVYTYHEGIGDEGIRVTMMSQFTREAMHLSKARQLQIKGLCTGYNEVVVTFEHGSIVK